MRTHASLNEEIAYLDATELAARIRRRELSPVEVVAALRERAEAVNPGLNAIVTAIDSAEDEARAAEEAVVRGEGLGPLHGVPFTIKDSIDTAGVRTTRGSKLFADHRPARDAEIVARLRRAGAIPLAKTNIPDFVLWWETDNLVFGRTVNPWNPERTAGGSSGGEAAAIAAGLSPLGIGSDLGGSIRNPAHHCGVVGLKPTHGRVPLTGHWPETILRFMHLGPLARSVRDAALCLATVSGPDGADWHAVPVPPPRVPKAPRSLAGLTVGWLAGEELGPVGSEVRAVVTAAAEALSSLGATVERADVPGLGNRDCNVLTMALYGAAGHSYLDEVIAGRWDQLHPRLARRLGAPMPTLDDYLAAEDEVEGLCRDLAEAFRRYDLLLGPTVPVPAHPHDCEELLVDGVAFHPRTALRATIPFDLTGSPALSVPFGSSADGLPIGVQLVGRHFDEETVFRAGMALEGSRGPLARPPLP
jgi:aspartyl-tRNA(Asn)/glutamyl-tRNA(Gln) amidotransferase subunit A